MIEIFAIHTAVLVGLLVAWAWKESYGGVFAGFAVPGYLAAIALVAPSAATTILIEAVLTYGITRALGDGLAWLGLTGRVFGRERFLLFVLCSVPVRLLVEGLAAGGLGEILGPLVPGGEHLGFFGVGLVLVPLTANTFWKLGLVRGVAQVAGTTGVTVLLMWALVMPLLQLELSSFLLTLENISADFLAAPKVTVLLLTTAVVATWTAERFGWNAGGLLVPSLLALLVFGPIKLVTTFVEIILLMVLYSVVTSLPGIRKLPLVGPRRLVAMYVLAWILKVSLAWTGLQFELPVAAWDLYGFGYLLSSLVAVRCLDLRPPGRVLVPMGINLAVGSALGLGAAMLLGWAMPPEPPDAADRDAEVVRRGVMSDAIAAAGSVREGPDPGQDWSGLRALRRHRLAGGEGRPVRRGDGTECLGFRPAATTGPRAWWCGGDGPLLVVLAPRSDPDTVWLAARMLDQGLASGLVLGGVDALGDGDRGAGTVARTQDAVPGRDVLLVRSRAVGRSSLEPRGALADSVRVPGVVQAVPLAFDDEPEELGAAWERLRERDGVLTLSVEEQESALPVLDEIVGRPERPAGQRPPAHPGAHWVVHLALSREAPEQARGLGLAASALGLRALRGDGVAWLVEDEVEGFGAWAVRPGAEGRWVVAATRAVEEPGVADAALALAEALDARATWLATSGTRGLEPQPARTGAPADAAVEGFREALRGTVAREPAAVVVVRRTDETVPGPRPAVVGQASASLLPVDNDEADALRAAVERFWPGAERLDPRVVGPPSLSSQAPLRYAGAMDPNRAWTLWLRRDVLAGAPSNPDHDETLSWYGLRGVHSVDVAALPALFGMQPDQPVDDSGLLEILDDHLEARTTRSLEMLRLIGQPVVVQAPQRLGVAIVTPDRVCLKVAGAPVDAGLPHAGCWGRR